MTLQRIRNNATPLDFTDERLKPGMTTEFVVRILRMMTELEAYTFANNESVQDLNTLVDALNNQDAFQARLKGRLTYKTLASLMSAGAPPNVGTDSQELAEVYDDGNSNGVYAWDGNAWGITTPWEKGDNGKSTYDLAVDSGYTGTIAEWLESRALTDGQTIVDYLQSIPTLPIPITQVTDLASRTAGRSMQDVAALVNDTYYTYESGHPGTVKINDIITTRNGMLFRVGSATKVIYDQETVNGIRLVLSDDNKDAPFEAFLAPGETDVSAQTDAFQRMIKHAVDNDVEAVAGGTIYINKTITPGAYFRLKANHLVVRADLNGNFDELQENDGNDAQTGMDLYGIFNFEGCDGSMISGDIQIRGDVFLSSMKTSERNKLNKKLIAISAINKGCSRLQFENLKVSHLGAFLTQGVPIPGTQNMNNFIGMNIQNLDMQYCDRIIITGDSGNMIDDCWFGTVRINRCGGINRIKRTQFICGALFFNGFRFDEDDEPETATTTVDSPVVSLSAIPSSVQVGSVIVVKDALSVGEGTEHSSLVGEVLSISGNDVTLDTNATHAIANTALIVDPPSIQVNLGSLIAQHIYIEGVFDIPFHVRRSGVLHCTHFKVAANEAEMRIAPVVVNAVGDFSVNLNLSERSSHSDNINQFVAVFVLKDSGGEYTRGRINIWTGEKYADMLYKPVRIMERPSSFDNNFNTDESANYIHNIQAVVYCGDGEVWHAPQLGSPVSRVVSHGGENRFGANLRTVDDLSADATAIDNMTISGGVATKAAGATGALYTVKTLESGAYYRVIADMDITASTLQLRLQDTNTTIETVTIIPERGRAIIYFTAPANVNRVTLFGFSNAVATISEFQIQRVYLPF